MTRLRAAVTSYLVRMLVTAACLRVVNHLDDRNREIDAERVDVAESQETHEREDVARW